MSTRKLTETVSTDNLDKYDPVLASFLKNQSFAEKVTTSITYTNNPMELMESGFKSTLEDGRVVRMAYQPGLQWIRLLKPEHDREYEIRFGGMRVLGGALHAMDAAFKDLVDFGVDSMIALAARLHQAGVGDVAALHGDPDLLHAPLGLGRRGGPSRTRRA